MTNNKAMKNIIVTSPKQIREKRLSETESSEETLKKIQQAQQLKRQLEQAIFEESANKRLEKREKDELEKNKKLAEKGLVKNPKWNQGMPNHLKYIKSDTK
jgi:hypothetical protein